MTDPITVVFGGICVAVISGAVGRYIGDSKKVSEGHCDEKRSSCQGLLIEKISNLDRKVDNLTKAVNNKIFGV